METDKIFYILFIIIFFMLVIIFDKINKNKLIKYMNENKKYKGLKDYKETKPQVEENIYKKRIEDKLEEPKRDYINTSGLPINVRTRGRELPFQVIGFLYRDESDANYNKDDVNRLMLMGRPKWSGSNKYDYYVTTSENSSIKIPIEDENDELFDGDVLTVTGFSGSFKVKLYEYKEMTYIPYI